MRKKISGLLFFFLFSIAVCIMLNLTAIRATIDVVRKYPIASITVLFAIALIGIAMAVKLK